MVAMQLSFKIVESEFSNSVILFQDGFGHSGSLDFVCEFQDQLIYSFRKGSRDSYGDCVEHLYLLGEYGHLHNINASKP